MGKDSERDALEVTEGAVPGSWEGRGMSSPLEPSEGKAALPAPRC